MTHSVGHYLGGEVVEGNGGNQFAPGIPAGTTSFWIFAEAGAVYGTINGEASPTTSPIYVPDGQARWFGYYDNIQSLGIYCAADIFAHITYEKYPA